MAESEQLSPFCLGILACHDGTNFQSILDRCLTGEIPAQVGVVISNNSQSGAMRRAHQSGINTCHLSGDTHPNPDDLDAAMAQVLSDHGVDLVVLAGYMKKLGPRLLKIFKGRVINIHPALLPAFGGKGMYGMHVHRAVKEAGDRESGMTIHYVNEHYDEGNIIFQARCPVEPEDTPEDIAGKVQQLEHRHFAPVIEQLIADIEG